MPPVLPLLGGLLACYLLAPFVASVGQFGQADWHHADLPALASAGVVSLASASAATALVALGGIPLGYLLARVPGRPMRLLGFLVQLPLALPPLASGTLLLFLLGYASPLGRLTHGALTDSFLGIVLAEAFVAAPFLIIAARSAFAAIDPALEDMAATMGHTPGAVFRRVGLPLAGRGIAAGLLLTWLRAFGEFGATVMVAYHPYSLPVYSYVAFGSEGLPAMLPILLPTLAVAALVMAASLRAEPRPAAGAPPLPLPSPVLTRAPAAAPHPVRRLDLAFHRPGQAFTLDVSWRTEARRLAILGASGSGKTAMLRLIAGVDRAAHAELTLGGRNLAPLPPHLRAVAYVPQSYALLPQLPVHRQVRFGLGADDARAHHWTQRLGLVGLEQRTPAELSLGQQQRVALARALSRPSRLLLLDEPFSALDAPLRAGLREELRALQDEIAATTILVTHDPAEAVLLADELLLLEWGRVLQAGPVSELFQRPASETAARLLGAETVALGHAIGPNRLDVGGTCIEAAGAPLQRGPVGWAVRRSAVRVAPDGDYAASVLAVGELRAGQRWLTLQLGTAVLQAAAGSVPPPPGRCRVSIDPAAIQVWPVPAQGTATTANCATSRTLRPPARSPGTTSRKWPGAIGWPSCLSAKITCLPSNAGETSPSANVAE